MNAPLERGWVPMPLDKVGFGACLDWIGSRTCLNSVLLARIVCRRCGASQHAARIRCFIALSLTYLSRANAVALANQAS